MDIGVGLPGGIPNTPGDVLVNWAKRGEELGFASLGVIDRLAYGNHEPLAVLAAAAAVTTKPRLTTTVLLGPLRTNHALMAKQAATIDSISGGRLVLGIGVGGRPDDFELSGADVHKRGASLEAQLGEMKQIWAGETIIGPSPVSAGGPELIIGGRDPAALARGARHTSGWIGGAGGLEGFQTGAEAFNEAWAQAGREGKPRLMGVSYFALGADARATIDGYIPDYYGDFGKALAQRVPASPDEVVELVAGYTAAGCDELVFLPCTADIEQLELLGKALSLSS